MIQQSEEAELVGYGENNDNGTSMRTENEFNWILDSKSQVALSNKEGNVPVAFKMIRRRERLCF